MLSTDDHKLAAGMASLQPAALPQSQTRSVARHVLVHQDLCTHKAHSSSLLLTDH